MTIDVFWHWIENVFMSECDECPVNEYAKETNTERICDKVCDCADGLMMLHKKLQEEEREESVTKMAENKIKNKMEQLAKSLGVELGQEVMLIIGASKESIKCRILEDRIEGYYEFPGTKGEWYTIAGTSSSQENERE